MSPDSIRSGDRYAMLPKSCRVTFLLNDSAFAAPKSNTFTSSSFRTRMFRGLRSPCSSERRLRPSIVGSRRVRGFEKPADLNRDPDGARSRQGPAGDHLGQVLAIEELHRDVEVRTVRGVLVHLRHLSIDLPQLLLILGSLAFRLDDLARLLVVADGNELQRHAAAGARVVGDEDVRHATTARRSRGLAYGPT